MHSKLFSPLLPFQYLVLYMFSAAQQCNTSSRCLAVSGLHCSAIYEACMLIVFIMACSLQGQALAEKLCSHRFACGGRPKSSNANKDSSYHQSMHQQHVKHLLKSEYVHCRAHLMQLGHVVLALLTTLESAMAMMHLACSRLHWAAVALQRNWPQLWASALSKSPQAQSESSTRYCM